MNLKNKISFIVSLSFTVIFGISATVIYLLYADFRQEEFENRLKEKALATLTLLIEMQKLDRQLLKNYDQNTINKLYNEKTLIFDADYKLIYSSLDDIKIKWTEEDLKYLKKHKTLFKKEDEQEIYGVFYDTNQKDYYALISAKDNFGKRKLEYLLFVLMASYIVFTTITWFSVYFLVKKLLKPIEQFHVELKNINENNLDTRIKVKDKKDEIDLLANEFNQMLKRIGDSYAKQKEFTANASHELRTPIARITAQLENKIISEQSIEVSPTFNETLLNDINQLTELTDSLLLLSKLDGEISKQNESCRIDDIIFESTEKISKIFPDFRIDLTFLEVETLDLKGNKSLLIIAITNLLKNAYLYSSNKVAKISVASDQDQITLQISNDGKTITEKEQERLYEPFMRGQNGKEKSGLGLGLRIVERILNQQNASIKYSISPRLQNEFKIVFLANH